jgi:hypothetical protein
MTPRQTCQTCAAYSAITHECRLNAPTAVVLQGPTGQPITLGVWPAARAEGWCMQWVADRKLEN